MIDPSTEKIINAVIHNLDKSVPLYTDLDSKVFSNNNIAPYFSGVGMHMRHILDIYTCVLNGLFSGYVDFTRRNRGNEAEASQSEGFRYLQETIELLKGIKDKPSSLSIKVIDDLGLGLVTITSTLAAVLSQAHSHAIHHYAAIGYLLELQDIKIPEIDFGYNPTTPIAESN